MVELDTCFDSIRLENSDNNKIVSMDETKGKSINVQCSLPNFDTAVVHILLKWEILA